MNCIGRQLSHNVQDWSGTISKSATAQRHAYLDKGLLPLSQDRGIGTHNDCWPWNLVLPFRLCNPPGVREKEGDREIGRQRGRGRHRERKTERTTEAYAREDTARLRGRNGARKTWRDGGTIRKKEKRDGGRGAKSARGQTRAQKQYTENKRS